MKKGVSALLSLVLLLCCSATACAASPSENGYSDVPENAWYADAVQYLTGYGIMYGTGNGRFSPDDTLTRAMTAALLYRAEGKLERRSIPGIFGFPIFLVTWMPINLIACFTPPPRWKEIRHVRGMDRPDSGESDGDGQR